MEAHRLRLEVLGGTRVLVYDGYDEEVYSYAPRIDSLVRSLRASCKNEFLKENHMDLLVRSHLIRKAFLYLLTNGYISDESIRPFGYER